MLTRWTTTSRSPCCAASPAPSARPYKDVEARTLLCGEPGSIAGTCWNGSPYQPVPVAEDVRRRSRCRSSRRARTTPRCSPSRRTCAPTRRRTASTPPTCSATSARSPRTSSTRRRPRTTPRCTAPRSSAAPAWRSSTTSTCAAHPATSGSPSTRWAGSSATPARSQGRAGDTLVTSIDARVQAVVEQQLEPTIKTARKTMDTVTGRRYVADSGAAVVMDATNGRIVAMAGQPTYDPSVWVGGITSKDLGRLYSEKAGTPLLFRATQGQFAPGSTWKPIMTAGALSNGYSPSTRLNCSSSFHGRQPRLQELRVRRLRLHRLRQGAPGLLQHLLLPDRLQLLAAVRQRRRRRQRQGPAGRHGQDLRLRPETGIDLRGRPAAGSPTGSGSATTTRPTRTTTASSASSPATTSCTASPASSASRASPTGPVTRSTSPSARATRSSPRSSSPGPTPRCPTAARCGSRGWPRRSSTPRATWCGDRAAKQGAGEGLGRDLHYIDTALQGTIRTGTMAWRFIDFPLDEVKIRSKTGSAEVYGKQSTSWVASYDERYVVVMMVSQGGTGSGTSGPAIRKIWETLYGVRRLRVVEDEAALPGAKPPAGAARVRQGRRDPSPAGRAPERAADRGEAQAMTMTAPIRTRSIRVDGPSRAKAPRPRLGAHARRGRAARDGHAAGLVGHLEPRRPHRRRPAGLPEEAAGQHRDRRGARGDDHRHRPPVGAHPRAAGLRRLGGRARPRAGDGHHHQRLALLDR